MGKMFLYIIYIDLISKLNYSYVNLNSERMTMTDEVKKLAPVSLTKKQRKHLERKSSNSQLPITTIVRQLIDKDIEDSKK